MNTLIIVGAPRSGTNALRDSICHLDGFSTWPCDEINYAWKFSNTSYKYDDLSVEQATPAAKKYIFSLVSDLQASTRCRVVVEKTCANCLRIPFVNAMLPCSRYLYIRRDPFDVVASSLKRWKASLDIPYILKKARFIPTLDIPFYGIKYLMNRFQRKISSSNSLPSWGPRFNGIDELRMKVPLTELILRQWYECCFSAERDLLTLQSNGSKCCFISYESFVTSPASTLSNTFEMLDYQIDFASIAKSVRGIHRSSVGKGKADLDSFSVATINQFLDENSPLPLDLLH